jgi:protein tyrosine phosphatase
MSPVSPLVKLQSLITSHLTNIPPWLSNVDVISKKFDLLREKKEISASVSQRNRERNRYADILCYDYNRFVIEHEQDYINASHVESYGVEYIVTQGPMENTVVDFYRMVMQSDTALIVMLTLEEENGQDKCVQYWPDSDLDVGEFKIRLLSKDKSMASTIRRVIHISNGTKEKTVTQVHFN